MRTENHTFSRAFFVSCLLLPIAVIALPAHAAKPPRKAEPEAPFPPSLPGGRERVTDSSPDFLKPPSTLRSGVEVAKTSPTVDFMYYPGQDYPGKPWSVWGDGMALEGKYYSAIGDHLAPGGNAFLYEYDVATMKLRRLMDVRSVLNLPDNHYTPGKIHTRIDLGSDGRLYFATHRGSSRATTDEFHYRGDWVLRCDPASGKSEVVAAGPVPRHCIPTGVLDSERLIFYGATTPGSGNEKDDIRFFAYNVKQGRLVYSGPDGPSRCIALAQSSGRVYFVPGSGEGTLMRFDPEKSGSPESLPFKMGMRAASSETAQGVIYTVSSGQGGNEAVLHALDTRTEQVENLGPAAVGTQTYITTLDADPTGRFLYYVPGAHGGSERDGSPVVRFDTQTGKKKIIAFLHPFYETKYGCVLKGTFSLAVDPRGDKLYITWNVSRGTRAWDCCALTVIHIPDTERSP